jgi:hypothetical protein
MGDYTAPAARVSDRYLTWCAALPHDVKDGKTSNNGATSRPFEAIGYPVQRKRLSEQIQRKRLSEQNLF